MTTSILSLIRTSLILAAVVASMASADAAGATPQKRGSADSNAAGASAVCGALGGTSQTVNDGVQVEIEGSKGRSHTSTTHCTGGLLGGMTCTNYDNGTSDCAMSFQAAGDASHTEDLSDAELGEATTDAEIVHTQGGASAPVEPTVAENAVEPDGPETVERTEPAAVDPSTEEATDPVTEPATDAVADTATDVVLEPMVDPRPYVATVDEAGGVVHIEPVDEGEE